MIGQVVMEVRRLVTDAEHLSPSEVRRLVRRLVTVDAFLQEHLQVDNQPYQLEQSPSESGQVMIGQVVM